MALTAQTSVSRALYTGMANAKVLAINPTLQELNDVLGIPAQQEPVYLKIEPDGSRKVRLEVHFETVAGQGAPVGIRSRVSLFTKYAYSKGMQTNNFGRFLNMDTADADKKKEFMQSAWQKPVYEGEMDLMMMLEQLLNPLKGSEFFMEKRDYLFHAGDTSELSEWLAEANKRKNYVQIMMGVQTDTQGRHYQVAHKKVLASYIKKFDKFHEQLVKQMNFQTDTDFGPIGISYSADTYKVREWFEGGQQQEEYQPVGQVNPGAPATPPAQPGTPSAPAPIVGGPLAAAAKPRFNGNGRVVKWAIGDTESGTDDIMSDDYNPDKLPF